MRLEIASYKAIKYACFNYHYSKSVPQSLCSYSVFNDKNEWCGVIIYSNGANQHLGKPFGLIQGKCCELVRVALNGKQESTSKALAISLKLIKKHCPLIELVVSYSDLDQNHIGILYQATNWIYLGEFEKGKQGTPKFKINNILMHGKSVYSKGWFQSIEWIKNNVDKNAELVYPTGKHKYVFPLSKHCQNIVKTLSKPYPKKEIN